MMYLGAIFMLSSNHDLERSIHTIILSNVHFNVSTATSNNVLKPIISCKRTTKKAEFSHFWEHAFFKTSSIDMCTKN